MLLACIIACAADGDRTICIVEYKQNCGEQYQCTPRADLICRDWQAKLFDIEYTAGDTTPPPLPYTRKL